MTKSYTAATIETALVMLGEWNHNSRSKVSVDTPDGARLFRQALKDAHALAILERGIHNRAERACSYPMTDAETARAERADARAAEKVAAILKPYEMSAKIGGDPRGSGIKLQTPKSGRHNTWGGASDGWAV
jgi:hypothetical protein